MTDERRQYYVGTVNNSPFQNITVGGFCFPKYTAELISNKETGISLQSHHNGDILHLSDDEVARIRKSAAGKVVRWNAANTRATMLSKDEKYRPVPTDHPVSEYIYLIPVQKAAEWNQQWRGSIPISLSETIKAEELYARHVAADAAAKGVQPAPAASTEGVKDPVKDYPQPEEGGNKTKAKGSKPKK